MNKSLPGLIALGLSVVLVAAGVVMLIMGVDARSQVAANLAAENITTPDDAAIPNAPVTNAATAMAQAEIIQDHTLETTGGQTWADMDREDELRPYYLQAVTLRTSLMSAYMGFKVAELVIGLGALFLVVGAGGGVATLAATRRSSAPAPVEVDTAERASV